MREIYNNSIITRKQNEKSYLSHPDLNEAEPFCKESVYQPEHSARKQKRKQTISSAPKKKKQSKHTALISFLIKIGVIGAVIAVLLLFVVNIRIIHTNNMYPSLRDGELVLISKISKLMDDLVVLYRTEDGVEHYGRILGMPESEIEIMEDTGVSVNGNIIYQTVPYKTPLGSITYPYQVPEDSYFILNDYREEETDSRTYQAIPKKNIIGVVIFALQYRGF